MNQILQEEQRNYINSVGKIEHTNQILDRLEKKMAGFHLRKKTEEQLLQSREEYVQPTKTKTTFKLFSKPQLNPMELHELELEASKTKEGLAGQLIQEVDAIQQLVRKKLALKEERVSQIERQVQLAGEEKLHLYKINCQLEDELKAVEKEKQDYLNKQCREEKELEAELKTLKQIYENKKNMNKSLRKEEEILRQHLKETQNHRKNYHQCEIRVTRQQSKSIISQKQVQTVQEEKYLRSLVGELDKLRKMVKEKMKVSASRRK